MDMMRDNCRADVRGPGASETIDNFHVFSIEICIANKHSCFLWKFAKEYRKSVQKGHVIYLRFVMMKLFTIFRHALRTLESNHSELVMKDFFSCRWVVIVRDISVAKFFP